jgi:hypothetical protein
LYASIKGAETPLNGLKHHPLVLAVLLVALFVRALVPEGFMPAQGEMVELCTMHGPRMALADPVTGELLESEDEEHTAPPCPFSLILTTLAMPSVPSIHLDAVAGTAPLTILPSIPTGRASLALPQARAPPSPRPA